MLALFCVMERYGAKSLDLGPAYAEGLVMAPFACDPQTEWGLRPRKLAVMTGRLGSNWDSQVADNLWR